MDVHWSAARLLVLVVVVGIGLARTADPASAGCVTIYRIYYDSPGSDTRTNKSLNSEWMQIKNGCAKTKALTGWKIKDAAGHTYTFPTFKLGAGKLVKVHTGRGTNTKTDLYWGSGAYIWNNDKDTARLINDKGSVVDKCSYSTSSSPNPVEC